MKIYVHHWFTDELFIKLAHNTHNRIYKLIELDKQRIGSVFCEYADIRFELVFNPILNDNDDGYHLIDFWTSLRNKELYEYYCNIDTNTGVDDLLFIKRFIELLDGKSDWLITLFRTEKLVDKYDTNDSIVVDLENEILKLNKHTIITDNVLINDKLESKYPNFHFALTNTLWQWNELINIRYWYEFSKVYSNLNFDYKLMYSVRRHKLYRVDILKNLAGLGSSDILLQRANFHINGVYDKYDEELSNIKNIKLNTLEGDTDFQNLKLLKYEMGVEYDVFFRFLNLSKMQILDESWSWYKGEFTSQYLSEKSFGLILAKIPFISTHSYPLDIIHKILNIEPHPFYKQFVEHRGNAKKFAIFVENFLKDFDYNYELCKCWTNKCHTLLVNKMENENSLLDLLKTGLNELQLTKSSKINLI